MIDETAALPIRWCACASVGIEDEADLLTDFTQALDATAVA